MSNLKSGRSRTRWQGEREGVAMKRKTNQRDLMKDVQTMSGFVGIEFAKVKKFLELAAMCGYELKRSADPLAEQEDADGIREN